MCYYAIVGKRRKAGAAYLYHNIPPFWWPARAVEQLNAPVCHLIQSRLKERDGCRKQEARCQESERNRMSAP